MEPDLKERGGIETYHTNNIDEETYYTYTNIPPMQTCPALYTKVGVQILFV
jgi:hypothetical protein